MNNTESRKIVSSDKAPKAIGPYSVAIRLADMLYTSGQIGLDPQTGALVSGGIEAETRQVLTNLQHVLEAGGSRLAQVVKTTVFLKDMAEFSKMNDIYAQFFPSNPPARSTVAVAGLPRGAAVEIEAVAICEKAA